MTRVNCTRVSIVKRDEVGEEGKKIFVFWGLGRGGGGGLERGLFGFLKYQLIRKMI